MRERIHREASTPPLIAEGLYSYQIGGSERVGVELAIEFARRGFRVLCFALYDSDGPMRQIAESAGVRCIDFNYLKRVRGVRRFTYQVALWRMLRRERVDALHVHHVTSLILSGLAARAAAIPRVVMTEHSLHQFKEQESYRRSAVRYCRLADAVTVVEPQQLQYFHDEIAVPSTKLHHVSNGVRAGTDPAARRRMRGQLGVGDDEFLLFFAGRLQPIKDVGTLLRSVAELSTTTRQQLRLVVAGDGPERERLQRECGELGLDRTVVFVGARNDVPTLMHAADAFIMTSISEGLPMALLEAMACGVPCIATAVGGIPELLAGGAGVLVPVANPPEIAKAIARLMADPGERATLSHRARTRIAERHDLDTIVTKYLALLGLPSHWPARANHSPTE